MPTRRYIEDYDWSEIQLRYDSGIGWRELASEFGTSAKTLSKATSLGLFKPRTQSESQKISIARNPRTVSIHTRELMAEHARRRNLGGIRNSIRFKYQTMQGALITLDSSYEVKVAESLDSNNIAWIRPGRLDWIDDNQISHTYSPDFYLPEYDVYLDPKNDYLIQQDKRKIELVETQNSIKVLILSKNNLTWDTIEAYIKDIQRI